MNTNEVVLTSCWHIGLNGSLDSEIIYDLSGSWWKNKPVLLLGDLIDCGIEKGMNFSNKNHPEDQIKEVKRITDILDVRGYVLGNHEQRIFRKIGLNPYIGFLGEPQRRIEINNNKFYLYHGKSNAANIFGEHEKLSRFIDVDVLALGHNHRLAVLNVLKEGKKVVWLRCGSFVKNAEYSIEAGYPPTNVGFVLYNTRTHIARLFRVNKNGRVSEI